MKRLLIFIVSLLTALPVAAQYKPGMSYLAMCAKTWPCAESIKVFDGLPEVRFRWLARTFNENCPCVERLLNDPRPKDVSAVLLNWTCTRRGDCGAYEALSGYSMKQADIAIRNKDPKVLAKFNSLITEAKKTLSQAKNLRSLYVVPCLECDLSDEARKVLFNISRAAFPTAKLIDSVYTSRCLKDNGIICEKHGSNPGLSSPCTSDLDGVSAQKIDVQKYLQRTVQCELQFLWDEKFNCIDHHIPGRVDPRKRTCNANDNYFKAIGRYLQPSQWTKPKTSPVNQVDLKGCKQVIYKTEDGEGGFTWKQSDTHPGIVALLPHSERNTPTLIRDGKTIASFGYAGTFAGDGRPMYRSSTSQMSIYNVTNAVLKGDKCRVLEYPGLRID